MRLWSTSCHLSLICLLVSSIWLVENQRFIRERTRRTKKSPGVQLFCGQFFQHRLTFFDDPAGYVNIEVEKSACWKPAFTINTQYFLGLDRYTRWFWLDISVILMLFYYTKITLPFIHSYACYFVTLDFVLICFIIYFYNVNVQIKKEKPCLSVNCVSFCK